MILVFPKNAKIPVVKSTVNYLLSRVDCEESESGSSHVSRGIKRKPKGSEVRKSHPAVFKAKIIHQCQPGVSEYEIAAKYGISQSLVSKWIKQKDSIITAATIRHKKLFAKQRPSRKYLELYRVLLERLKEARAKGLQVNFNWLWSKARTIYREQTNDDNKIVKKHVITTFLRRYNVRMRSRQRNRTKPKEAYRDDLMKWHSVTRERLIRTGSSSENYDPKWGRFKPSERFNVDHTPMPFAIDVKRTYEVIEPGQKHSKTWIKQPGAGVIP